MKNKKNKKILFYTANGVGLGHLRRTCLIAEKLKEKQVEIILVTPALSPRIFGKFYDKIVRLTPISDELFKNSENVAKARVLNCGKFKKAVNRHKPDLIVADFYLSSPFTFSAFSYAMDSFPIKSIFIWRLDDVNKFCRDLKNETDKLSYFKKIILPHDTKELEEFLPNNLFREIKASQKFEISGSIFRETFNKRMIYCRQKYKISPRDFFITITLGGGGKLEHGECESANKIIKKFLAIYNRLNKAIPELKVVIVLGPYFKSIDKASSPKLKIIKFEKYLPELMAVSNLVISTAGYNTCNEIINSKIPSILIPLSRGGSEQFERALYMQEKGLAQVFTGNSSNELFNVIMDCKKSINKTKLSFQNFPKIIPGNQEAAKIIIKTLNE